MRRAVIVHPAIMYRSFLPVILVLALCLPSGICAQEISPETDSILTTADSLFKSMHKREYARIWELLSEASRNTIVQDTFEAIKGKGGQCPAERISADFSRGDTISKAYWDAFLQRFSPDMILNQSTWEMESIKDGSADIRITYKKARHPAILRMFKEGGSWKVGLTESFWTRK